jgi:hypothetical protein
LRPEDALDPRDPYPKVVPAGEYGSQRYQVCPEFIKEIGWNRVGTAGSRPIIFRSSTLRVSRGTGMTRIWRL